MNSIKKIKKEKIPVDNPIPAGTEQETGFTRAETEKVKGPLKIDPDSKNKVPPADINNS